MFGIKSKVAQVKIDSSTAEILELATQKKRLEMERDQIALELDNVKSREKMKLEVENHKHTLKLQEEKAVFERERKVWEVEKKELEARAKREKEEFETRLKADTDLKMQEAVTLTKLDAQQKVIQTQVDKDRVINDLKTSHSEQMAKVKTGLAEEYYEKLTVAFQEIQMNGDKNSKFVQELALKIFDQAPKQRQEFGFDVNMPQLSAAK